MLALERSGPDGMVALACDTPFVAPRLLAALAALPETTLVRAGGRLHPLPGRYAAGACAPLAAALAEELPLLRALLSLGAEILDEPDDSMLLNLNDLSDLQAARARLAGRDPGARARRGGPGLSEDR